MNFVLTIDNNEYIKPNHKLSDGLLLDAFKLELNNVFDENKDVALKKATKQLLLEFKLKNNILFLRDKDIATVQDVSVSELFENGSMYLYHEDDYASHLSPSNMKRLISIIEHEEQYKDTVEEESRFVPIFLLVEKDEAGNFIFIGDEDDSNRSEIFKDGFHIWMFNDVNIQNNDNKSNGWLEILTHMRSLYSKDEVPVNNFPMFLKYNENKLKRENIKNIDEYVEIYNQYCAQKKNRE